jgi:hypothetical protein
MKPFELVVRRDSTECARVTVHAENREEAERLAEERAKAGELLWEDECESICVETAT